MSGNKFRKFLEARPWNDNLALPFVDHAKGDHDFPNVETWDILKSHLDGHNAPHKVVAAAEYVWNLYVKERDGA